MRGLWHPFDSLWIACFLLPNGFVVNVVACRKWEFVFFKSTTTTLLLLDQAWFAYWHVAEHRQMVHDVASRWSSWRLRSRRKSRWRSLRWIVGVGVHRRWWDLAWVGERPFGVFFVYDKSRKAWTSFPFFISQKIQNMKRVWYYLIFKIFINTRRLGIPFFFSCFLLLICRSGFINHMCINKGIIIVLLIRWLNRFNISYK